VTARARRQRSDAKHRDHPAGGRRAGRPIAAGHGRKANPAATRAVPPSAPANRRRARAPAAECWCLTAVLTTAEDQRSCANLGLGDLGDGVLMLGRFAARSVA